MLRNAGGTFLGASVRIRRRWASAAAAIDRPALLRSASSSPSSPPRRTAGSTAYACRKHGPYQHGREDEEEEGADGDQNKSLRSETLSLPTSQSNHGATNSDKDQQRANIAAVPATRPMTMQERFRQFPFGVAAIFSDCLLYKNIRDASRTPLNGWTLDSPVPRSPSEDATAAAPRTRAERIWRQDSLTPGRVPRRQHEHQRRLVEDLHVVLPLVVAWLPPIVGYLPMALAVLAPRQVLTRPFWNEHEVRRYAAEESVQRHHFYREVSDLFWSATASGGVANGIDGPAFDTLGLDAAGPVIDPRPLFAGLEGENGSRSGGGAPANPYATFLASVDGLPDAYLVPLALATGSFASAGSTAGSHEDLNRKVGGGQTYLLPRLLAGWLAPRRWLRYRVRRMARAVADDDALLIEEGAHANDCQDLTDREVADACLLRGLPISNSSVEEMRQALSNHLAAMALVHHDLRRRKLQAVPSSSCPYGYTEAFGLLSLHLPILRASLCWRCAQERAVQPPKLPLKNL